MHFCAFEKTVLTITSIWSTRRRRRRRRTI